MSDLQAASFTVPHKIDRSMGQVWFSGWQRFVLAFSLAFVFYPHIYVVG